ncbi:hypothetical protein J7J26_03445 [Candidatus Micrarchaeota archaeon]|nr:hypothetical protein [Candidatus Micrarchaeota archaeon]
MVFIRTQTNKKSSIMFILGGGDWFIFLVWLVLSLVWLVLFWVVDLAWFGLFFFGWLIWFGFFFGWLGFGLDWLGWLVIGVVGLDCWV